VKTEGRTKYLKCSTVVNWTKPVHYCGPTLASAIRSGGLCPVSIKHDGTDRTDGTMMGVRSATLATGWLFVNNTIVVLAVLGLINF